MLSSAAIWQWTNAIQNGCPCDTQQFIEGFYTFSEKIYKSIIQIQMWRQCLQSSLILWSGVLCMCGYFAPLQLYLPSPLSILHCLVFQRRPLPGSFPLFSLPFPFFFFFSFSFFLSFHMDPIWRRWFCAILLSSILFNLLSSHSVDLPIESISSR